MLQIIADICFLFGSYVDWRKICGSTSRSFYRWVQGHSVRLWAILSRVAWFVDNLQIHHHWTLYYCRSPHFISSEMLHGENRTAIDRRGSRLMLLSFLKIYVWPPVTLTCDLLTPFHAFVPWTTCANLHQSWFIRFQTIVLTSLITEERMDVDVNKSFYSAESWSISTVLSVTMK